MAIVSFQPLVILVETELSARIFWLGRVACRRSSRQRAWPRQSEGATHCDADRRPMHLSSAAASAAIMPQGPPHRNTPRAMTPRRPANGVARDLRLAHLVAPCNCGATSPFSALTRSKCVKFTGKFAM